jgi:membrane-associated protease RseP (regulator of RpoE activity)
MFAVLGIFAFAFVANAQEAAKPTSVPATFPTTSRTPVSDVLVWAFSTGGQLQTAYLGVSTSPAQTALQKQLQLKAGVGLVVDAVTPGGPAEKAGLKQYDILHKLDDQLLINAEQLDVLVRSFAPGRDVKLAVIREGKATELAAKLEGRAVEPARIAVPVSSAQSTPFNRYTYTPLKRRTPVAYFNAQPEVIRIKDPNSSSQLSAAQIIIQDETRKTTLSTRNRQRQIKVEDKAGKVLFEGPIDTKEQFDKVPPDLRGMLKEILIDDYTPAALPQTKPTALEPSPTRQAP